MGEIETSDPTIERSGRWRTIRRAALALAIFLSVLFLGQRAGMHLPRFVAWVESLGPWGPVAFVAAYILATVAFIPGTLMTLVSGALFGLVEGAAYAFLGETLGGIAAFTIARRVARRAVERRLAASPRFAAVDRAVRTHGRRIIFLLRLSPAFPFNFLNYALGLTNVRFADYAVASFGMLPGTTLYVYYGMLAGDVAAWSGGENVTIERGALYYTLLALGLVATLAVTMIVTRIARRALAEETGRDLVAAVDPAVGPAPPP